MNENDDSINWYFIAFFFLVVFGLDKPFFYADIKAVLYWCLYFALMREYHHGKLPFIKPKSDDDD